MSSKKSIALADKLIAKHKKYFDKWLRYVRKAPNDEEALYRIWGAAMFAKFCYPGMLSCDELDKKLLDISSRLSFETSETFVPNSFLHIVTSDENYGGQGRLTERWIENSPLDQKHSVLFTDQRYAPVPQKYFSQTKLHNGEVIIQSEKDSIINKAIQLHRIASNYEYIILNNLPYDIVPLLAFGTEQFPRPVMYYNAGDHTFWPGGGVADGIINFRHFSDEINVARRGLNRNFYLPLPIDQPIAVSSDIAEEDIDNLRENLKFKKNDRVLFTMARSLKYKPAFGYDFVKTVDKLLQRMPDLKLLAIGPSSNESYWRPLVNKYGDRVKLMGIVPADQVSVYLELATLVWDSFPMGSLTSLLDATKRQKPVLSLETPGLSGLYEDANISCKNEEELLQKSCDILTNPDAYTGRLYEALQENNFIDGWRRHLENLLHSMPLSHKIWSYTTPDTPVTDFERCGSLLETPNFLRNYPVALKSFIVYGGSLVQKYRIKYSGIIRFIRKVVIRILSRE